MQAVATPRPGPPPQTFRRDVFLSQTADQVRQSIQADTTVIALRQGAAIICVARSGSSGPPLGSQLDSRFGISGECLRRRQALLCKDSETDPRVDAEVCRRLGIRSVIVVPVLEGAEAAGLIEAFSSRPYAFQDEHVSMLEKTAATIADSRARTTRDSLSGVPPLSADSDQDSPATAAPVAPGEWKTRWMDAFRMRPYQIAIVIGFLVLDLVTIYWWKFR